MAQLAGITLLPPPLPMAVHVPSWIGLLITPGGSQSPDILRYSQYSITASYCHRPPMIDGVCFIAAADHVLLDGVFHGVIKLHKHTLVDVYQWIVAVRRFCIARK